MTTNAHLTAQGNKFLRGVGSPLVYTAVAGVDGVAQPGKKRKALDVTTQDQSGVDMQYVASALIENTLPAFELLFNPADSGQTSLFGDFDSTDPVAYQVQLSSGTTYSFLGVITDWAPAGKKGELIKVKVTISICGAVTVSS